MIFIILLVPLAVAAQPSNVAVAVAVTNIELDGDLSDWPDGMRRYPIERTAMGTRPANAADFTGYFQVGYHPTENALYVAVQVTDQSAVTDSTRGSDWFIQDGCELYIDLSGNGPRTMACYVARGRYRRYFPPAGGTIAWQNRAEVKMAGSQTQGRHAYEWRLDMGRIPSSPKPLRSGLVFGFDLGLSDVDADQTASLQVWGGTSGTSDRGGHSSRRGYVVLVEQRQPLVGFSGRLAWENGLPVEYGQMHVRAVPDTSFQLTVQSNKQGAFKLELPSGTYEVTPLQGLPSQQRQRLVLEPGRPVERILPCRQSVGTTVNAGPGRLSAMAKGIQKGVWQTYSTVDGLPSNAINAIIQDRAGYLWLATPPGVSRYDGEELRQFTMTDGLEHNAVSALLEDRTGNLWMATWEGSVSRYDGKTFTTFTIADGLADTYVNCLLEDRRGHLWFGTRGGGVSRYDGQGFSTFTYAEGMASNHVTAMAEDGDGNLWFAGEMGGVTRFDGTEFSIFHLQDGLPSSLVHSLYADSAGRLWLGTTRGVCRFDNGVFQTVEASRAYSVNALLEDYRGDIWFGSDRQGVCRLGDGGLTCYTVKDGLASDRIWSMLKDRQDNIWISFVNGGLSKYAGLRFEQPVGRPAELEQRVESLLLDRDNKLWFGTHTGLVAYKDERFSILPLLDRRTGKRVGISGIPALGQGPDGDLWIGTWGGGALRYNGEGMTRFALTDGLPHADITAVFQDRNGDIWLGTWGGGASRYDGREFVHFTTEDGLVNNEVVAFAQLRDGTLLMGGNGGITFFKDGQVQPYAQADWLSGIQVTSLLEDRQGDIWAGTSNGLLHLVDGRVDHLSAEQYPFLNKITCLFEDPGGHLWIGTLGNGVSRYDGQVFQTLLSRDGLLSDQVRSIAQDQRGGLWFATDSGAMRYHSAQVKPVVHIQNLIADQPYGPLKEIALPAEQDYLAFHFKAPGFGNRSNAMVYRYRLAGYQTAWKTTRAQAVEYYDLPRGDYSFEVMAVDQDLNYGEPQHVAVRIYPTYERFAWIGLLGLAALVVFWQSWRVLNRGRQLRLSNAELSRANRELNQKTTALEQVNQKIQTATRAKSAFLANMSHELRTPMNSILGFTELLKHNREYNLTERQQRNLNTIYRNADQLLQLINQVLDLSKIEAGRMDVSPERFDLADLVNDVSVTVEPLLSNKPVELIQMLPAALPLLFTDKAKVGQILLNLLSNAAKCTEQGQITVGASMEAGYMRLWVADTGIGIPAARLESIFEEFQQVENGTNGEAVGTGLGLAITRRLCQLLDGDIRVESKEGEGAIFTVRLPVTQ